MSLHRKLPKYDEEQTSRSGNVMRQAESTEKRGRCSSHLEHGGQMVRTLVFLSYGVGGPDLTSVGVYGVYMSLVTACTRTFTSDM